MKTTLLQIILVVIAITVSAQGQDPSLWLSQLTSTDPTVRQSGFYAIEKAGIASTSDQIRLGLINLLSSEQAFVNQQATLGVETSLGYGDYFGDVVNAVASLHDGRSVNALSGVLETGDVVTETMAGFGASALPSLFSVFQSSNPVKRFSVVVTIGKMITPANLPTVSDAVSRAYIRTILSKAAADTDSDVASSAQASQAVFDPHDLVGDLNDDNKIDCNDLAIVKAAFGKKTGQSGFDPRADLNLDGVIDVRDLAFVSQKLAAGSRCS